MATQNGWREIHYAAFEGELEKVKELAKKEGIDEVGPDGKSALHQAAGKGHEAVVKYLIEQGANTGLRDGKGRTPAQYAKQCGQHKVEGIINQKSGGESSGAQGSWKEIHYAAFEGELAKVQELLSQGVKVDDVGPDGKSALHQAAGKGHMKVVEYLLQQKANPQLRDQKGRTPGLYAKQCGQNAVDAKLAEVDKRPENEMPEPEPGELGPTGRRRIQQWVDQSPHPPELVQMSAEQPDTLKPVRTPR